METKNKIESMEMINRLHLNRFPEIFLQERTDRALWSIPGGCQELGERLEETALREFYEENGIKLKEI